MTEFFPPPADFLDKKVLNYSKQEMTRLIFSATIRLNVDNPEFTRYWDSISAANRDLFIAQIVDEMFAE